MTVYVDNAQIQATVGRWNTKWSHMWADTQEELHEFANRLGLKRAYFQAPTEKQPFKNRLWHYDVTESKRITALKMGAQHVEAGDLTTHPASGQYKKLHEEA